MESTTGIGYYGEPTAHTKAHSNGVASFVQGQTLSTAFAQQQTEETDIGLPLEQPQPHQPQHHQHIESDDTTSSIEARAQQGRLRAQAILRRFQEQQETLLQLPTSIRMNPQQNHPGEASQSASSSLSSSVYIEQRRKATLRQRQRFHDAWIKNFAYVERKQEASAHKLQQQIVQAEQREVDAANKYQRIMEERKQKQKQREIQQSQAGIGTQKRRRVEITKAQQTSHMPSVAVYITGIPRNQSISSNMIRDVFRSYGNVTKVHFYRDKASGELKGDGLVAYQVETPRGRDELLETVCSQMNGAELADGVVISVEPAGGPPCQPKEQQEPSTALLGRKAEVGKASPEESDSNEKAEDDEDLDDFFNSL